MSKRRLSKQQRARINKRANASNNSQDSLIDPSWESGIVVAHHGKRVDVQVGELFNLDLTEPTSSDSREVLVGHIRANLPTLVCGDRVYFQRLDDQADDRADCVIEQLQARRTELNRPRPYSDPKPFASNVDLILLVIAPEPEPITNLIDRYLIAAEQTGIEVILVINKTDLLAQENYAAEREELQSLASLYESLNYRVFAVSSIDSNGETLIQCQGHQQDLYNALAGKASILVGQSGVGKSTIINAMADQPIALTGNISESSIKGKHTTTHSSLFILKLDADTDIPRQCAVIDSPGVREFGLWHLSDNDIIAGMREFSPLASQCKYRDCDHKHSDGCAIQAAFVNGDIHPSRIASYQHILASREDN